MSVSNIPSWLGAPFFAVCALILAFVPYMVLRRLFSKHRSEDSQNLSTSVIVRLGALHALILALVFAQEQINYTQVRTAINQEAAATADVYYGLKRYDQEKTHQIRVTIAKYVQDVIEVEWPLLSEQDLSDSAWEDYSRVEVALLRLDPHDLPQRDLRSEMLADWDDVSGFRRARETAAKHHVPNFFWTVAVLGFVLVAAPYFAFEPSRANLFALAAFAVYNGVVLYFIASIDNPFAGPAALDPTAFEKLFSEDMVHLLGGGGGADAGEVCIVHHR